MKLTYHEFTSYVGKELLADAANTWLKSEKVDRDRIAAINVSERQGSLIVMTIWYWQ